METLLCWGLGLLFGISVYLLLNRNLVRVLFGITLISTTINLLIFTLGRLGEKNPAFVPEHATKAIGVANALPQALILTAIVIGFGVFTFSLILITKAWQELGTMNVDNMLKAEPRPQENKPQ
ncbi:MAG: NADH-quinone oxidoreductase subunit K [Pseudomonadota bacterium]